MKKKKTTEVRSCARCGGAVDPVTSICPVCASASNPGGERRGSGILSALFLVPLSLLLSVSILVLVLILFLDALNAHTILPAMGWISGDWLALIFDSWYSYVLAGVLVLIPLLLITLASIHRIRRFFLAVGSSAVLSAMLLAAAALTRARILPLLSGQWQDALIHTTNVFRDFSVVCALILIAVGAACLSVYSCIAVIKGGRHEKDT